MKRIFIRIFALSALLAAFNVNALGIVEKFCNEEAFFLSWENGFDDKEVTEGEVLSTVYPQLRSLVQEVISLPPKVEEKKILDLVKIKTHQDIRVWDYTAKLIWHLPKNDPVMVLDVFMYKGCISSISVISLYEPRFFFIRRTELSREP